MRVYVKSKLPCPPERAWDKVQTSGLLVDVARPMVMIRDVPEEPLPERWQEGTTVRFRNTLFGFIPWSVRSMTLERIDQERREIQTREHDLLVRKWDHLIRVQAATDGTTVYSDAIEINAGLLTPAVALFAWVFYHHRQRRWQRIARELVQAPA